MRRFVGRLARLALAIAIAAPILLLALIALWRVAPPVSTLMLARYMTGRPVERTWVPLEKMAPALPAAVVMSEDARFCRHSGVDWQALGEVLEDSDEDGPSRGASTIAMQTVKNLFLWPSRSVVRKALEIPLALALDLLWPKRRVIEVYLNIAEWGPGVFGAEAAARENFGKSASALSLREAALLTTALPNPFLRKPNRPRPGQVRVAERISARVAQAGGLLDCLQR